LSKSKVKSGITRKLWKFIKMNWPQARARTRDLPGQGIRLVGLIFRDKKLKNLQSDIHGLSSQIESNQLGSKNTKKPARSKSHPKKPEEDLASRELAAKQEKKFKEAQQNSRNLSSSQIANSKP
jgi:hypothetical protein